MSPLLFLSVTKSLLMLLHQAEAVGHLFGVSITIGSPYVTSLLFANDSLLFFHDTPRVAQHLLDLLRMYESAFG